jgi:hypothetical protein
VTSFEEIGRVESHTEGQREIVLRLDFSNLADLTTWLDAHGA